MHQDPPNMSTETQNGPGYTEHHYKSTDGLTLYFRSYGSSGPVLLCLPGLTRNCKDFEHLALRHAPQWRVITPDFRGRGQSDRDLVSSRYQHLTYIEDTWKLLNELGIQELVILGTSLGGWIATLMAVQQPDRVQGVVVNDIGPVVPDAAVKRLMKYVGLIPPAASWDEAANRVEEMYKLVSPDRSRSFWLSQTHHSMRETSDGLVVPDMDPAIGTELRKSFRKVKFVRFLNRFGLMKVRAAQIRDGYWSQFRKLVMPSLLLRGAMSDVLPEETMREMQVALPHMEAVTVARRGHAPYLDEPEAVEAIDRFLQQFVADS